MEHLYSYLTACLKVTLTSFITQSNECHYFLNLTCVHCAVQNKTLMTYYKKNQDMDFILCKNSSKLGFFTMFLQVYKHLFCSKTNRRSLRWVEIGICNGRESSNVFNKIELFLACNGWVLLGIQIWNFRSRGIINPLQTVTTYIRWSILVADIFCPQPLER